PQTLNPELPVSRVVRQRLSSEPLKGHADTQIHVVYTAQYVESTTFIGTRILSVPGGDVVVRFVSYQIGQDMPMTIGFAATIARSIPMALEERGQFQEAFVLVSTAEGRTCGMIGLGKRIDPRMGISSVGE
ncbi:MAG: hypothetical protein Q9184_005670, partial [Pyrenodesmia sp. 2 TL-2023]